MQGEKTSFWAYVRLSIDRGGPGEAEGSYAADAAIGLNGRYSNVVQKHWCRLADVSFARASAKRWEQIIIMIIIRLLAAVRLSPYRVA